MLDQCILSAVSNSRHFSTCTCIRTVNEYCCSYRSSPNAIEVEILLLE